MAAESSIQDSELEARYDKYKGIIKDFTLMSDIFMRNVFKQRECLEYVLQVIMEKHDLRVIDQIIQKDYKNMQGHGAATDKTVYNTVKIAYGLAKNNLVEKISEEFEKK